MKSKEYEMSFEIPDLKELIQKAIDAASMLYQENRTVEAEIVLNQLFKVDPNNIEGYELFGLVKHRQGKYEEAIE
jgi:tetratricopeptide (TPR) repeat protein